METSCHPNIVRTRRAGQPAPAEVEAVAAFFHIIGDPTRVRILWALDQGELCVGDLSGLLDMTVSAISHQLKLLKDAGLVRARRAGKHIYYALDDDHVRGMFETAVEHLAHKQTE